MSVVDKRLQPLLDQERYALVSAEAQRSGRSVAVVIRQAIDISFANPDADAKRVAAAGLFLEMTADPDPGGDSEADISRLLDEEFDAYVSKKAGL
ncbi:MAG: hypothetical protein WA880_03150 [Ornithinimicrobium sp.]